MKSPYLLEEQETTINVYHAKVQQEAEVYTSIPSTIQQLNRLAGKYPDDVSIQELDGAVIAVVPRKWIKISPPRKLNLSDEERQKRIQTLLANKAKKEEQDNDAT